MRWGIRFPDFLSAELPWADCLPPPKGTGPGGRSCTPAHGLFSARDANSSPAGPCPEYCTTLQDFLTNAITFKIVCLSNSLQDTLF